jgi:hypothetical protein
VVTLVNTEVSAPRVIVQQNDAGEASLVIERDMGDDRFDHGLQGIHAAKRIVTFI